MKQIIDANGDTVEKEVLIPMDEEEAKNEGDNKEDIQEDDVKKKMPAKPRWGSYGAQLQRSSYHNEETVTIILRIQLKPILMMILNTLSLEFTAENLKIFRH